MSEEFYIKSFHGNFSYGYESFGQDMIDWYLEYQVWIWSALLLFPLVMTFLLPLVMLSVVYVSALYLKAYRYYFKLNGYTFTFECWETPRNFLAYIYDLQARFWYGYEIEGFENIPNEGPALIVFYHGSIPVDWFYLLAKSCLYKKRLICFVGDRFLFKIPALDGLFDCCQIYPGTIDTCADILKRGNLLAIAPGGAREAMFGDESYPLIWGSRIGFAKVAMEAKVPIIPVFTENIREAFFTPNLAKKWLRGIYERTRIPVFPIYGGFPVKLKTFIGPPIAYNPDITAEEMAAKVRYSMKSMIKKHQNLPGSLTRSIAERFRHLFKVKQV